MPVDEPSRHRLFNRLEEVLGPQEAASLMTSLPAYDVTDIATKADLQRLSDEMRTEFIAVRTEMQHFADLTREEFATVRAEMSGGFTTVRAEMSGEFATVRAEIVASQHETVALLRQDIANQTRNMIFAMVGVVMSLSSIALFR